MAGSRLTTTDRETVNSTPLALDRLKLGTRTDKGRLWRLGQGHVAVYRRLVQIEARLEAVEAR